MNAIRSWEADLGRRLGIGGLIQFDKTSIAKTLHIPCAVGEHVVDFNVQANLDPNGTVKRMIHAGWIVGRRRLVCPDCNRRQVQAKADARHEEAQEVNGQPLSGRALGQKKMMEATADRRSEIIRKGNRTRAARKAAEAAGRALSKPVEPPAEPLPSDKFARARAATTLEQRREWGRKGGFTKQANKLKREGKIPAAPLPELRKEETIMASAPPAATDKARAAKREAMDLLTLAFKLAPDGKSGTYQDGYSDARIAKETGIAESAVATLREDFFGSLGAPDELVSLRLELQRVAGVVVRAAEINCDAERQVKAVERKLTVICQKQGWPVA